MDSPLGPRQAFQLALSPSLIRHQWRPGCTLSGDNGDKSSQPGRGSRPCGVHSVMRSERPGKQLAADKMGGERRRRRARDAGGRRTAGRLTVRPRALDRVDRLRLHEELMRECMGRHALPHLRPPGPPASMHARAALGGLQTVSSASRARPALSRGERRAGEGRGGASLRDRGLKAGKSNKVAPARQRFSPRSGSEAQCRAFGGAGISPHGRLAMDREKRASVSRSGSSTSAWVRRACQRGPHRLHSGELAKRVCRIALERLSWPQRSDAAASDWRPEGAIGRFIAAL